MAYALALASAATEGAYLEAAATLAARARGADVETPDLFAAAILLHQQTEDAQWGELCKANSARYPRHAMARVHGAAHRL